MTIFQRLILIVVVSSGYAWADKMTPETYIRVNSEARKLTLDGMEKRIALLTSGATQEQQIAAAEKTNEAIDALFKSYDTTASIHAAFGTYHQEEIKVWLDANPAWSQNESDLDQRFKSLSGQIDELLEGQ